MSGRSTSLAKPGALAAVCAGSGQDSAPANQQSIIPPQAAEPDAPVSQDADAPASSDTEKAP